MVSRVTILLLALAASVSLAAADGFRLAPYKDKLFANPKPFKLLYDGSLRMVEYSVERDLRQRDAIPEKKAKEEYVSLDTKEMEQTLTMRDGDVETTLAVVGNVESPKAVFIFLHGRGAGLADGFDDWTFGGNFNRLKNLMMRSGGAYVSPSFSDFDEDGRAQIKGVMKAFAENAPGAPIFVACASAAGSLCVSLVGDPETEPMLGGILFLGASVEETDAEIFTQTKRQVPIYIGHGSKDPVVNWVSQEFFLKQVKEAAPDYPIRFNLFVPGYHGTPMRMTDWRKVINWMLSVQGS
jgi:hypothetical protein